MSAPRWDSKGNPRAGFVTSEQVVAGAAERWGTIETISPRLFVACCEKLSKKRGGGPCPYVAKWRLRDRAYCNWHVPVGGWVARQMLKRQKEGGAR